MKPPSAPRLDERRAAEFSAELRERARAWIPSWDLADGERDFGRALLQIAARFSSEVAERLDGAGEKMRRGFLDWLAVRGEAARPARMPVVFKLADAAQTAVLATAPVRLQADAAGTSVVFETEKDVRIVPGTLGVVVGVDADSDAFYLPAPGLSDLQALEPLPTQWLLKSFAAAGATTLQLDPETGLVGEMLVEAAGQQYRIVQVDKDIVTIEPGLTAELNEGTTVEKVTAFEPFGGSARNRQEHALYLGHSDLLNIEAAATLEILGATELGNLTWQYWGKVDPNDAVGWQPLTKVQQPTGNTVVLTKPIGAVDPREIDGKSSRWIRAFTKTVTPATAKPFRSDELRIRINSLGCGTSEPCPPHKATASPAAEAMANTTPLVLDNVFFPLGKEPRQFDAFYLGSQEAFSKTGAEVQLCFEMADPTFAALSVVREGVFTNIVLAGVGQDRALHLLQFNPASGAITKLREREALQPPQPGYLGSAQSGNTVALDQQPTWRLPVWSEPDFLFGIQGFLVATTAGDAIWVWHEHPDLKQSGWINVGPLPATGQTPAPAIDGLVYLASPAKLAALRDGHLFVRDWPAGTQWEDVDNPVLLKSIVPVLTQNLDGRLVTSESEGMVAISTTNRLFQVSTTGVCTPLLAASTFNAGISPAAVKLSSGDLVVVALDDSSAPKLITHHDSSASKNVTVDGKVIGSLEPVIIGSTLHVLASVVKNGSRRVVTWAPYASGAAATQFASEISVGGVEIAGGPTALDQHLVIPGNKADILVSDFDLARRRVETANVNVGIVVPDSIPALAVNDLIVRKVTNAPVSRLVTDVGLAKTGEVFYPIDSPFPAAATGQPLAYAAANTLSGTFTAPDQFELDAGDRSTATGMWLLIDGDFYSVDDVDTTVDPWMATISSPGGLTPAAGTYLRPIATGGRIASFMNLDPSTNGNWDAGLLARVPLMFPDAPVDEQQQRGKAFSVAIGNKPTVVVLNHEFQPPLVNPVTFLIDAAVGEWQRQLGDTSSNPELSWEYWNGKGWWNLDVSLDQTLHLKTTGAVRFKVPTDIASSDWAGKTNHWIRARLIGGDYGREKVTVTTKDLGGGKTEQTVERSNEGIRAPSALSLHISYAVCDGQRPGFVLAQDSGTIRDQSDANRTGGAIVEAFVPLAVMLGRLSNAADADAPDHECPQDCHCKGDSSAASASPPAETSLEPTTTPSGGRLLFIGLTAFPSEAPVNVLLLVDERPHTAFAPMTVDALVGDRFVPILANDETRALGETGVLSMSFVVPPTPRNLFGQPLTWLRLTPKKGVSIGDWKPMLRGAYLNAVFASAAETLTRELIGSSDGAPNLTVTLARPPVLHHTLELRVKEPLGEEERAALKSGNERRVLSGEDALSGDWVLWEQAIDPSDEPASARVYALDEMTGEIRFGDGLHGTIPPIGQDSIVAFSYKRTEPGPAGTDTVPGNAITARTPLNLVSPVEGVEAVFAADQAAGGAPPESDDRVLRFGFSRVRHRNRAVTARDIEDLALQSSPDIVQARTVVRRGYIRLVIVMRGGDPVPSAAQVRELGRLLLAAAPAALSAPGALRIEGPAIRRLRIDLTLRVETLDVAGAVASSAKKQLARLFDTAAGGTDQEGWPLGANPSEEDVALALINVPDLEGIASVALRESPPDGHERPWPAILAPTELVMLANDPIRIQFETAEVLA